MWQQRLAGNLYHYLTQPYHFFHSWWLENLPSAAQQKKDTVFAWINAQQKIRVLTDAGPNFGNQAHSLNLIAWLRQLGYRGKVELIYPNSVRAVITTLLDLPAILPDCYDEPRLNLQLIAYRAHLKRLKNHRLDFLTLGLSGVLDHSIHYTATEYDQQDLSGLTAEEQQNPAVFCNVGTFIQFDTYIGDEASDTLIYQRNQTKVQRLSAKKTFINMSIATLPQAKKYLTLTKRGHALSRNLPALSSFIAGMEQQQFNVMPLYGWPLKIIDDGLGYFRPSLGNVLQVLAGARYAQCHASHKKPLVLAVFYPYEKEAALIKHCLGRTHFAEYEEPGAEHARRAISQLGLANALKIASVREKKTCQQLQALQADDILLLSLGALPKIVFDGLYYHRPSHCWPAIREGANALNALLLQGRPHFRCGPWEMAVDDMRLKKLYAEGSGLGCDMKTWLQQPLLYQTVGELILEAQDKNTAFSRYFMRLKEEACAKENDRFMAGFRAALDSDIITNSLT